METNSKLLTNLHDVVMENDNDIVRAVCTTCGTYLSGWITRSQARTIKEHHEYENPTHATTYEES